MARDARNFRTQTHRISSLSVLHWTADVIARRLLFHRDDTVIVSLAEEPPPEGCPVVPVAVEAVWQQYTLRRKIRTICSRRWSPTPDETSAVARSVLLHELFGSSDDAGEAILDLMRDHWEVRWKFDSLTEHDRRRADAIRVYTLATQQRFRQVMTTPPLNLRLLRRSPLMCTLVNPMLLKIPVTSLQYFIDIHVHFAFNQIRRSQHPHAGELISLIYEVLFLQQKTALTLKALLEHIVKTAAKPVESLLVQSEADAIMSADLLFVYEKATVEKAVALVGHTLELRLENKKEHKKRVEALRTALPPSALSTPYGSLLMHFISSDALERLNASRSGLLHKMGIADLQPHNYVGGSGDVAALRELFVFLHDQHAKNTLTVLAALALLTDDLLRRDPPSDVPEYVMRIHSSIADAVERSLSEQPAANVQGESAG